MSLTYTSNLAELALLSKFNSVDPNFLSNLPSAIEYSTNRIVRELNLLSTITSNSSLSVTPGTRIVNLSALNPVVNVIQDINVVTPSGTTNPDLGQRSPLTIQSRAFMNQVYGSTTVTGVPQFFHMVTDQSIMVGPYPDNTYTIEIIATVRPVPISVASPTNWISTYLADLFLAGEMIQMSAFKMNFGAESDDPQQAQSWEAQFVKLRDSAATEDAMRRYFATGWTSQLPSQFTPART
jgi:hypothetical protein